MKCDTSLEAVSQMSSVGSDKDRNRGCKKKDKDHMELVCELYEAQAARETILCARINVGSELEK